MSNPWSSCARLIAPKAKWCVILLLLAVPFFAHTHVNAETRRISRSELLEARLQQLEQQRQRWQRVIATQQELARNPSQFSQAASDAARDLKQSGIELAVDGLSAGIVSTINLQAAYARRVPPLATKYQTAASIVNYVHLATIKQAVRGQSPGKADLEDQLAGANALLDAAANQTPPRDRAVIKAFAAITRGGIGNVAAFVRGDKQTLDKTLDNVQVFLGAIQVMLDTMSENPAALKGVAAGLARKYPSFGPIAGFMASTALIDFKISVALAQIGYGLYGIKAGYDLLQQAEAIYVQQQHAAVVLQRLLPRAREEVRRAEEEMTRVRTELEASLDQADVPLTVLPTNRFIDNGVGIPLRWADLPSVLTSINQLPGVTARMTDAERRRRLEEAEQRRRQAEEEARRAAQQARQAAEERHPQIWNPPDRGDRPSRNEPSAGVDASTPPPASRPSTDDDSKSCFKRDCLGEGGRTTGGSRSDPCKIIEEINKQTRGSTLGSVGGC